jgi:hypothetical protein
MPGTIEEVPEVLEGPKMTTFLQLTYAGLIGGMLVLCALSIL